MSIFTGYVNFKENNCHIIDIYKKNQLDEFGYYFDNNIWLSQKNIDISNIKNTNRPISIIYNENTYTIVLNGKLYNIEDIKNKLIDNGFEFLESSDEEILLKAFIFFSYDIVKYLNGSFSFAIWNKNKKELFIARDHFGTKPLYYTLKNNTFIFSSEIKAILKFPIVNRVINSEGISELIGIGPAHTPGTTLFKDIYEIKPAHFAIFNNDGLHLQRYWKLEMKEHTDSLGKTCETIYELLGDSIKKQSFSNSPICSMLSGGLDSSIITAYVSNFYKDNNLPTLITYSVDYVDNDINFVKSDFQPNSDKYYIDIMRKKFGTIHKEIIIDTPELTDTLYESMIARDMPGMADVDSSLYLFCINLKNDVNIALSGECSDEIFGGYPWFFREDALNSNTFPWSIAISERQNILNKNLQNRLNLKEYIDYRYNESLSQVTILENDSEATALRRKISHLTFNWFMQTLLDRSERMATANGIEIRVPFCDYRLVEYTWNIPWEIKALNGREKGLLRYIVKKLLPQEIVDRKKSPYPKTHNPTYLAKVKEILSNIMQDKNAPINNLLNRDYILEILKTNGKSFSRPWFGQLMTAPQLMAYLIQINMWLEEYKPEIEI